MWGRNRVGVRGGEGDRGGNIMDIISTILWFHTPKSRLSKLVKRILRICALTFCWSSKPAVPNLWAAAHWWASDLCLVGCDHGWELINFFDVSHVSQYTKRYQVLLVELELPLHTQMISEHIKKFQS